VPQIFVASDGTGNTAEQALKAALTQFEGKDVEIKIFGEIRTELQVHLLVREAKQNDAFIVHTLVSDRIREEMHRMAPIIMLKPST
jgi:regulator of PEP synthase PpsR (kinase-PPPase family)